MATTSEKVDRLLHCRTVTGQKLRTKRPKTVRDYLSFFGNVLREYGDIAVFVDRHDGDEDELVSLADLCVMHEMFSQNPQRVVVLDAKAKEAPNMGL